MKIFNFLHKNDVGEPPWDYYFLQNLDEKEYPRYLAKLFYLNTGEKLPLLHGVIDKKRCKTFNQKIQWIKLYGVTDLMRDCTDKVKVRDYVKEKIGEEYLKPVLQIIPSCHSENLENPNGNSVDFQVVQNLINTKSKEEKMLKHACINAEIQNEKINKTAVQHDNLPVDFTSKPTDVYFDRINWNKLPNSFVIKCNHGCKWQCIIKNKEEFLQNKRLFELTKQQITGWLEQDYSFWGGFELNYRNIEPKILIEPLMREEINIPLEDIHVYCFKGEPKIIVKFYNTKEMSIWNENLNSINDIFVSKNLIIKDINTLTKQMFVLLNEILRLSKQLSKDFNFLRCDWVIYQNKLYFEELTFTPYSGFMKFKTQKNGLEIGEMLNLERY